MNISSSLKSCQLVFSDLSIYRLANSRLTVGVDIKQIRRDNMLALIGKGTKVAFASKVGTDPAYISQILSIKTKADVGNELARAIEKAYKLPYGWMDARHGTTQTALTPDQLMLAEAYPSLPPEKKAEWLDRMAQDPARYKALLDALLTEVSQKTVRVNDRRKPSTTWAGIEKRKGNAS